MTQRLTDEAIEGLLFNCLNENVILSLFSVSKRFAGVLSRVRRNPNILTLHKEVQLFPNIKVLEGDIEAVENVQGSVHNVESYHLHYSGCYLMTSDVELNIRPSIISITSMTNCLSPFNGLMGMSRLEEVKIQVYFDDVDSSEDEDDRKSFLNFFNCLSTLPSLKVVRIHCRCYDVNTICEMTKDLTCKVFITCNEFFGIDDELKSHLMHRPLLFISYRSLMSRYEWTGNPEQILQLSSSPKGNEYTITDKVCCDVDWLKLFVQQYMPTRLRISCSGEDLSSFTSSLRLVSSLCTQPIEYQTI